MIKFLIYLVLIACGAYLLSHLTKKTKFLIYLVATLIYLVWASHPPTPRGGIPHLGNPYIKIIKIINTVQLSIDMHYAAKSPVSNHEI